MTAPSPAAATPSAPPVRHYQLPPGLGGKLHAWRFLIARRLVQLGVLALFIGTLRWGWNVAGRPLLAGDLSASELLGAIPMADPFAVLQILVTGHWLETEVLAGAAVVLAAYLVLGGRVFCAWVCPMNAVTDAAGWLRAKLRIPDFVHLDRSLRYWVFGLALALSALAGVAAFEWVSPVGTLHRALVFGAAAGGLAALGIFLFDLLVIRHGWCGHLCPLGAFWSLVGRTAQVRVAYDAGTCTRCGDCVKVCPEPPVLNFAAAGARGMVVPGECSNCGRCVGVCPEGSLKFALRVRVRPVVPGAASPQS
jgi:ferredoxin-type protein NapH